MAVVAGTEEPNEPISREQIGRREAKAKPGTTFGRPKTIPRKVKQSAAVTFENFMAWWREKTTKEKIRALEAQDAKLTTIIRKNFSEIEDHLMEMHETGKK